MFYVTTSNNKAASAFVVVSLLPFAIPNHYTVRNYQFSMTKHKTHWHEIKQIQGNMKTHNEYTYQGLVIQPCQHVYVGHTGLLGWNPLELQYVGTALLNKTIGHPILKHYFYLHGALYTYALKPCHACI